MNPELIAQIRAKINNGSSNWISTTKVVATELLDEIERLRAENSKLNAAVEAADFTKGAWDVLYFRARIAELEAEKKTWKNALEELTPGGSEFVDDPKRCADFVRVKIKTMWKAIAAKNRRVAELENILDIHIKADMRTQHEVKEGNWEG